MLERQFPVEYVQRVLFTRDVFACENATLCDLLAGAREPGLKTKALAFVDSHVLVGNPSLPEQLEAYAAAHGDGLAEAALGEGEGGLARAAAGAAHGMPRSCRICEVLSARWRLHGHW